MEKLARSQCDQQTREISLPLKATFPRDMHGWACPKWAWGNLSCTWTRDCTVEVAIAYAKALPEHRNCRGLWSVFTCTISRPKMYSSNFSHAIQWLRAPSRFESTWVFVWVRALDAKLTGCWSWSKAAPSPVSEASHWRVTSSCRL